MMMHTYIAGNGLDAFHFVARRWIVISSSCFTSLSYRVSVKGCFFGSIVDSMLRFAWKQFVAQQVEEYCARILLLRGKLKFNLHRTIRTNRFRRKSVRKYVVYVTGLVLFALYRSPRLFSPLKEGKMSEKKRNRKGDACQSNTFGINLTMHLLCAAAHYSI